MAAIVPWGDVIEDFLGPLDLDCDGFAERMTGGWLFGYVRALDLAGFESCILCISSKDEAFRVRRHAETGVSIFTAPRPRAHRLLRGRVGDREGRPWMGGPLTRSATACVQYVDGAAGALWSMAARAGAKVLLVQEYEQPRFDILSARGVRVGLPVYGVFQGGDQTHSPLERPLRRATIKRASGLIIPSSQERRRLERAYRGALPKIWEIPNPLDVEAWGALDRDRCRAALGLPNDAVVLAWHGRIDIRRKGLDILLGAWTRLLAKEEAPPLRLVLTGGGQSTAEFRDLIAASGAPGITWLDVYTTDRGHIRRMLSAADIYVFPSRVEGMPVAPLEAMAAGLPVVAGAAQGVEDIFPGGEADGGLVVPTGSVDELTLALERLLRDAGLRKRLGAAARRRVETAFSLSSVAAALRGFLAAGKARRAGELD